MPWSVKHTFIVFGVGVSVSAWAALLYVFLKTRDDVSSESKARIHTSRQSIIRLKVPNSVVGSLIGRNGSNIKEIQQKTNTRINFEDSDINDCDERTVIIRGSPENAQEAENLVNKAIAEQPEILTEEIFIPARSCGRIIGKHGENIKFMSRASKAKISINCAEDRGAESTARVVLRGTREQIDYAIGMIDEKLAEEEIIRCQVELLSANRSIRYNKRLCIENDPESEQTETVEKMQETLISTANDGFLEVFISAVDSPSRFWVQLVGTKSIQLDKMVEAMTSFYSQEKNQELCKVSEVAEGDLVAAPFPHDELWYRARVTKVEEDDYSPTESKITVFYVDFGDDSVLSKKQVFALQPEFLVIPFQAIECCLADVEPREETWSEEDNIQFEKLTYASKWKTIMAKPLNFITKDDARKTSVACVELVDTNGPNDINIGKELIRQSCAVSSLEEMT